MKTGRPDASSWARELSISGRRSFGDLARRLAGWAPAMPWWAQSHDRVIRSFLGEPAPERPVDIESRACAAVGDEFYARLNSGDTGLGPAQWLRALVEETGARLQAAIACGADDWRPLAAVLRGLAGIAPEHEASPDFPDIKFPRQTAAACLMVGCSWWLCWAGSLTSGERAMDHGSVALAAAGYRRSGMIPIVYPQAWRSRRAVVTFGSRAPVS